MGKKHALAIAKWEKNSEAWLRGDYAELRAGDKRLQKRVGDGGTLWVVVSHPGPERGRRYRLMFRFDRCRPVDLPRGSPHGRHAVQGDPEGSAVFPPNDAKLLLMSLRFDPYHPLQSSVGLGGRLRNPRRLRDEDVALLKEFAKESERWSVFISYAREDRESAEALAKALERSGISVFRDEEKLLVGSDWKLDIERAIDRAFHFVLLISPASAGSGPVREELERALDRQTHDEPVHFVPILLPGGSVEAFPQIQHREARPWEEPKGKFLSRLVTELRSARLRGQL